jgi:lipoprotein-anchoring transpeptidase ErfK/SrfK
MLDLKASEKHWIEINLSSQRLFAWNGSKQAYAVIVSTGKKATPTPTGIFSIKSKRRLDRMRGEDYDLPDVPYVMYFHQGYAIHGTYWHKRFGTPVSHGCINLAVDRAKWLFDWSEIGTPVIIHE